jgi:hypothetical protein
MRCVKQSFDLSSYMRHIRDDKSFNPWIIRPSNHVNVPLMGTPPLIVSSGEEMSHSVSVTQSSYLNLGLRDRGLL